MKSRNAYILFLVLLASCIDHDLRKSIFIPDPEHPQLPKYSESGLNTFGAYVDREPFFSNDTEVPAKVIWQQGKTSFLLTGQKGAYSAQQSSLPIEFSINFLLPTGEPKSYDSLLNLHNSVWDLTDSTVSVILTEGSTHHTLEILNGTLHFVRAQHLFVDQQPREVILSGVFEFQASGYGSPLSVLNGRFDIGVSDHNFFKH